MLATSKDVEKILNLFEGWSQRCWFLTPNAAYPHWRPYLSLSELLPSHPTISLYLVFYCSSQASLVVSSSSSFLAFFRLCCSWTLLFESQRIDRDLLVACFDSSSFSSFIRSQLRFSFSISGLGAGSHLLRTPAHHRLFSYESSGLGCDC